MDIGRQSKEARQQKKLIGNQWDRQWEKVISTKGNGPANMRLASLPMEKYAMMENKIIDNMPMMQHIGWRQDACNNLSAIISTNALGWGTYWAGKLDDSSTNRTNDMIHNCGKIKTVEDRRRHNGATGNPLPGQTWMAPHTGKGANNPVGHAARTVLAKDQIMMVC